MRRFVRNNGLSLVLLAVFLALLVGHSVAGYCEHNEGQTEHGKSPSTYGEYLVSGEFIESVFENWESEFLQMGAFIYLTAVLFQKGSPESKDPDKNDAPHDEDPRQKSADPNAPWPVRKGGWVLKLYEHSLSMAFMLIFVFSFAGHAIAGRVAYSHEQVIQGQPPVSLIEYVESGRFWFESMQNWQSEFLSIAAMVILGIFLRERGSKESKPVATPHWENE